MDLSATQSLAPSVTIPSWDPVHRHYGWQWLVVILALALAVDLYFFTGYTNSGGDDDTYFTATTSLLETGTFGNTQAYGIGRLVIVGWNYLIAILVGPNIQFMAASYLSFHLLLILFTFLLGRRAFNGLAGLIAAYYVATVPLILLYSSTIMPDVPLACFLVLSVLIFTYASDFRKQGRLFACRGCLFAAGIALGLAYSVKESGLILLPFYFVWWLWMERMSFLPYRKKMLHLWHRRPAGLMLRQDAPGVPSTAESPAPNGSIRTALVTGVCFALGILLVFSAEQIILASLFDKPVFRLGWMMNHVDPGATPNGSTNGGLNPITRFKNFLTSMDRLLFPISLKLLFAGSLLLYPFIRRRKWSILLAGLWLFLYLNWGSQNLHQYIPHTQLPRYFIPVIPFLCLVVACVFTNIIQGFGRLSSSRVLKTSLRGAVLAMIIIIPLYNLGVADRLAGRLRHASFIGSAVEAIRVARLAARETHRPIVLSWMVINRVRPIFYHRHHDDLLTADKLTRSDIERLVSEGGFYYIGNNRRALLLESFLEQQNCLDEFLFPFLAPSGQRRNIPNRLSRESGQMSHDANVVAVPLDGLRIDDLVIVKLANFSAQHSRTAEIASRFFKSVPQKLATCDPFWSLDLYRIMGSKKPVRTAQEPTPLPRQNDLRMTRMPIDN